MSQSARSKAPLAYRMAPETLADFVGQRHILAEGKLLRRLVETDQLSSLILFGPPGSGKTSLAKVIANTTKRDFRQLNAVTSGVADIKAVIQDSQNPLLTPEGKLVLFVDEIHRFNKAQQDALLPAVENGSVILIGATTENPYFEVNKALISRSTVFQLYPLEPTDIKELLERALKDEGRGYGRLNIELTEEAEDFLANSVNGDARVALNALELAVLTTAPDSSGKIVLDLDTLGDCLQQSPLHYDKSGEGHYDTISAFIKSMRGSDPDAALYYLARMIASGEDVNFIARRIVICAAEDVGLANPQILTLTMSAWDAVRAVGMPEARIILSMATLLVASSPKSNSAYLAIEAALDDVRNKPLGEVPMHLRNAAASGMADLGYGKGYKYSHDYPFHVSPQHYLPDNHLGVTYYRPGELGYEKQISKWMEQIEKYRREE